MIRTTINETIETFNAEGVLIERTTREEHTEDDTPPSTIQYPYTPWTPLVSYSNCKGGTLDGQPETTSI